ILSLPSLFSPSPSILSLPSISTLPKPISTLPTVQAATTITTTMINNIIINGESGGWRVPREILEKLEWKGPLVVVGKQKNDLAMKALSKDQPSIFACPWSPGASYTLEILDRMVT